MNDLFIALSIVLNFFVAFFTYVLTIRNNKVPDYIIERFNNHHDTLNRYRVRLEEIKKKAESMAAIHREIINIDAKIDRMEIVQRGMIESIGNEFSELKIRIMEAF